MVDTYTKILLTIIALALSSIAVQGLIKPAPDQVGAQDIRITEISSLAFQQLAKLMTVREAREE